MDTKARRQSFGVWPESGLAYQDESMNSKHPSLSGKSANPSTVPDFTMNTHLVVGGSQTAGLPMTSRLTPVLPSGKSQSWLRTTLVA
jgi:hypothetical protein